MTSEMIKLIQYQQKSTKIKFYPSITNKTSDKLLFLCHLDSKINIIDTAIYMYKSIGKDKK